MNFQQLYEVLVSDIDYDISIGFVEKHIKKESLTLDAGCGTGVFLVPLAKKGYQIEGIDYDSNMLAITYDKLRALNLYVPLFEHDLREPIYKTYDQIIMMNDVINYFKGVKLIFKQLKKAINQTGFILFDCYKTEYLTEMHGYIEEDITPVPYKWTIDVTNETMSHTITSNNISHKIKQTIKPLSYYIKTLEELGFKVIVLNGPDERKHYIKASL